MVWLAWWRELGNGRVRSGLVGQAWRGGLRSVVVRCGRAVEAKQVEVSFGAVWSGMAGGASTG